MKCEYFDTRSMIIYRRVQKANKRTGMYNQEKHHPSILLYIPDDAETSLRKFSTSQTNSRPQQ